MPQIGMSGFANLDTLCVTRFLIFLIEGINFCIVDQIAFAQLYSKEDLNRKGQVQQILRQEKFSRQQSSFSFYWQIQALIIINQIAMSCPYSQGQDYLPGLQRAKSEKNVNHDTVFGMEKPQKFLNKKQISTQLDEINFTDHEFLGVELLTDYVHELQKAIRRKREFYDQTLAELHEELFARDLESRKLFQELNLLKKEASDIKLGSFQLLESSQKKNRKSVLVKGGEHKRQHMKSPSDKLNSPKPASYTLRKLRRSNIIEIS